MLPPDQNRHSTYLDRLIALKLLRENIFIDNPEKYSWSDIAEDMPGAARAAGGVLKNIAPSLSIIDKNPAARKAQIDKAVERIKNSQGSKEGLKKEIIDNVISMAKGSVIPTVALSLAFQLLGIRLPWFTNALGVRKFTSPINPIRGIKNLLNSKRRLVVGKNVLADSALGVGLSAAGGALVPLAAHGQQVSPKALEEAREILEKNPYLTSLPAAEMMSVIKQEKNEKPNRLKNIAIGTGLGALQGGLASLPLLAWPAAKLLFSRNLAATQPLLYDALKNKFKKQARNYLGFGGVGIGGLTGAYAGFTSKSNVIDDEYEKIKENKKLDELKEQNDSNSI
jgi:hypothetical protein